MKLKKHNKKGMTLVECIIAMALLGAMSGMLVTIAVAAKRQNLANYQRSAEMYKQATEIEQFNPDYNYGSEVKVQYLISKAAGSAGVSGNEFKLGADFGTYKLNTKTYGFKSNPTGLDKNNQKYSLKALKSEFSTLQVMPNLAEGKFVVKVYNDAGYTVNVGLFGPDSGGGMFYDDTDTTSLSGKPWTTIMDGGSTTYVYRGGSGEEMFDIVNHDNADGSISAYGTITKDNYETIMERDDKGYLTGYMIIHIDSTPSGLVAFNADDHQAYQEIASELEP
ncbi:MAG: prepilin-type N-terminal cleavage/methylation domain-containing protein [Ruminococcus sp.]|nr:prepilin-type N-terminal cleavage/methylation domain-containing protein [Ruminococcus sp.]